MGYITAGQVISSNNSSNILFTGNIYKNSDLAHKSRGVLVCGARQTTERIDMRKSESNCTTEKRHLEVMQLDILQLIH